MLAMQTQNVLLVIRESYEKMMVCMKLSKSSRMSGIFLLSAASLILHFSYVSAFWKYWGYKSIRKVHVAIRARRTEHLSESFIVQCCCTFIVQFISFLAFNVFFHVFCTVNDIYNTFCTPYIIIIVNKKFSNNLNLDNLS